MAGLYRKAVPRLPKPTLCNAFERVRYSLGLAGGEGVDVDACSRDEMTADIPSDGTVQDCERARKEGVIGKPFERDRI